MDAFVTVSNWTSHPFASSQGNRSSSGHNRSLSSIFKPSGPKPSHPTAKSPSASDIPVSKLDLALEPSHPNTPQSRPVGASPSSTLANDDHDMSTLPDSRSRVMSPANLDGPTSPHHPDLDDEVAMLSTKLVNAINRQTNLDDTLSATRLELDSAREQIRQLEATVKEQRELLAGDVWVRRKTVEAEKAKILQRVADEKKLRQAAEQEKRRIEQELENLTTALFEEANKMVISAKEDARLEHEALQRKIDQLKAQLADTEGLLRSQQEQLAELKQVMEQMSSERDDQTVITVPSSPGFSKIDSREEDSRSECVPHAHPVEPPSPSYPTSFTHLVQPVLRTDLASFNDFRELIRTSKRLSAQRIASAPVAVMGGSSAPASAASSPASTPQIPSSPPSVSGFSPAPLNFPSLKETKFYKRALAEDIEPTLRLDTAPGLSWLARRNVLHAMTEGFLVVEPVPTNNTLAKLVKPEQFACSLCGESRKENEHLRHHRFRTSESDSAQRYPLCKYCLNRVRSTCDFLGFMRIVKDGHWRADDDDAEKAAWEESVRLREQMFWSRIGGGVVPTNQPHVFPSRSPSVVGTKSPRASVDDVRTEKESQNELTIASAENDEVESAKEVVIFEDAKDSSEIKLVEKSSKASGQTSPTPGDGSRDSVDPESESESRQQLPLTPTSEKVTPRTSESDPADSAKRLSQTIPEA